MAITHEQAAEMQRRVNELKLHDPNMVAIGLDTISFVAQNSPPTERTPKTATTIGGEAERGNGAAMGRPQRKKNPEWEIQAEYVRRMEQKHPLVMVFSDTAAHIFKTKLQQIRANKLQSKLSKDWPDCFIAQPSGDYAGLFLEFKAESPYLVSNPCLLKKSDHVEAQYQTMKRLSERGYDWAFVWSVEMAMEITEKYLNQ